MPTNGIGTAHALARMYAALIGEVDGIRLLQPDTVAAATRQQAAGKDQVSKMPSRHATGYQLPTSFLPSGPPAWFGHPGRSGALAWADPELGLAFGLVTNYVIVGSPDTRAANLVAALVQRRSAGCGLAAHVRPCPHPGAVMRRPMLWAGLPVSSPASWRPR